MPLQLVILGCGSATPTLWRKPSAQWLRIQDADLLIDCGEGTQLQMLHYKLKINKLQAIFISHMHGDHYLGLPGILSSMHLTGRITPLQIFGPEPLWNILQQQFEVSQTRLNYPIQFTATNPEKMEELGSFKNFSVHAFPLNHRIPCTGFLFRERAGLRNLRKEMLEKYRIPVSFLHGIREGHDYRLPSGELIPNKELTHAQKPLASYAYCSDTAPDPGYLPYIREVDCLYHEATFTADLTGRARETFHSTALEAAEIARNSQVSQLLIGHFSSRYRDTDKLIQEARSIFEPAEAVYDGMCIEIKPKHTVIQSQTLA